jgi:hypothetical protein
MVEFDNAVIKMSYSPDNKIITSIWKKNPVSSQIKEAMEFKITIAKKHQTGKLYFDLTNLGSINNDDDVKWLSGFFIPHIISAAGFAKIANVVPVDVFTKIPPQEILTTTARMSFWHFDNKDNALAWLKEENNQVKDLIKMYPCDLI